MASSGGDGAQQTWRAEDLNEFPEAQENCLADELQSGLYLSEFSSDSMKEIIQSIISDEGIPPYCGGDEQSSFLGILKEQEPIVSVPVQDTCRVQPVMEPPPDDRGEFGCVLKLPTACTLKTEEIEVTYMNRGQVYSLVLTSTNQKVYQSALSVEFHDLRLRNYELDHLSQWMQLHPQERLITLDKKSSAGIYDVSYPDGISKVEFTWNSAHETVVAFSLNCLSSEFTQKKHGGEKGVLLRLIISNSSDGDIMKRYCLVKVFKDKGADRKQKQDLLKREKLPAEEAEKYWISQPFTFFKPLQFSSPTKHGDEPAAAVCSGMHLSSQFSPISSPQSQAPPQLSQNFSPSQSSPLVIKSPCSVLTTFSNVDETTQWLLNNRFASYVSLFANFCGSDFLRMSRRDLMDICGSADGIRLFNALHSHPLKRVYICLENESVFHGIFLESTTADYFKQAVSNKLSVSCSSISTVLMQPTPGILVNVDNLCVENMFDEQCFIVRAIKEEDHESYQLILQPIPDTVPNISVQGMAPRFSS